MADPLPEEVFPSDEAAVVVFARASTLMKPITSEIWSALTDHFTVQQIVEISFIVGMNQLISRFHAAVRTDVDGVTLDQLADSCPVRLPQAPEAAFASVD